MCSEVRVILINRLRAACLSEKEVRGCALTRRLEDKEGKWKKLWGKEKVQKDREGKDTNRDVFLKQIAAD